MNEEKIARLDSALVEASKKIKVLNALAWPAGEEEKFLESWARKNPRLPEVRITPPDVKKNIATLDAIASQCDPGDPVGKFLLETAQSYADAGRMISAVGTPQFTHYSTKIYGRPDMVYKLQGLSAVDGALFFLNVTDSLLGNAHIDPTETDISAKDFAGWLKSEVDEFFALLSGPLNMKRN
jgi:hypothetical protein